MTTYIIVTKITIDETNPLAPDLDHCRQAIRESLILPGNEAYGVMKVEVLENSGDWMDLSNLKSN